MRVGKSMISLEGDVIGRKLITSTIWFSSDVNSLAKMAMSSSFFFRLFCLFQTENKLQDKSEHLGKRLEARKFFRSF